LWQILLKSPQAKRSARQSGNFAKRLIRQVASKSYQPQSPARQSGNLPTPKPRKAKWQFTNHKASQSFFNRISSEFKP